MSINYTALAAELAAGHPDTGAYDADDQLAADQMNVVNRTVPVESVSGSAILNATDDAEYTSLTDTEKTRWLGICGTDSVDVANGVAKAEEADLFGTGTATRANLAALKTRPVSRAVELALGVSAVTLSHVVYARTL